LFVASGLDPAQPGAVLNQDNRLNTAGTPAARGSAVQIFGTGYGQLDGNGSAPVEVWFGNYPAQVLFSAPAPGVPGLWQINATVPERLELSERTPLFVRAGGRLSNAVVSIRPESPDASEGHR
jgi:uncharacterized protein (TIGR03437 family)